MAPKGKSPDDIHSSSSASSSSSETAITHPQPPGKPQPKSTGQLRDLNKSGSSSSAPNVSKSSSESGSDPADPATEARHELAKDAIGRVPVISGGTAQTCDNIVLQEGHASSTCTTTEDEATVPGGAQPLQNAGTVRSLTFRGLSLRRLLRWDKAAPPVSGRQTVDLGHISPARRVAQPQLRLSLSSRLYRPAPSTGGDAGVRADLAILEARSQRVVVASYSDASASPVESTDDGCREIPTFSNSAEIGAGNATTVASYRSVPTPKNTVRDPVPELLPTITAHRATWIPDALEPPFFKPTTFFQADPAPVASLSPSPSRMPRLSFLQRLTRKSWASRSSRDSLLYPPEREAVGPHATFTQAPDSDSDLSARAADKTMHVTVVREKAVTHPKSLPKLALSPKTARLTIERLEVAKNLPEVSEALEQRRSTTGEETSSSARVYSPLKTAMLGRKGWLRRTQLFKQTATPGIEPRTTGRRNAPPAAATTDTALRWPEWVAEEWQNPAYQDEGEDDRQCEPPYYHTSATGARNTRPIVSDDENFETTRCTAEELLKACEDTYDRRATVPRTIGTGNRERIPAVREVADAGDRVAKPGKLFRDEDARHPKLLDVTASRVNIGLGVEKSSTSKDWEASMQRYCDAKSSSFCQAHCS
jgi:hypothetical protein